MKIKRKELITNLEQVLPGVESGNNILDGADTIVFTKEGIFTYNDNISVAVPVNTGIVGALKSKELYTLLKKLKGDTITVVQKKGDLHLKCAAVKAKLKLVDSTIEQYIQNLKVNELKWKPVGKDFMTSLKLCRLNISNSPLRGIYVADDYMYSTDEIRIAFAHLKESYDSFWIDDSSAIELLKIGELISFISVSEGWVHFKTEQDTIFSCKTNELSQYPFEALLKIKKSASKKKNDIQGVLPTTLKESIDRVSTLAEDLQGFSVINLTMSSTELVVSSKRSTGEIEETIPWEEELKIKNEICTSADAGFLMEAISKTPTFYITNTKDNNTFIVFTSTRFMLLLSTIK